MKIADQHAQLVTLPDGVSTTFTSSCAWGCIVRTLDGAEQSHTCVGEQLIAVLAPELTFARACEVAAGLQGLLNQQSGEAWEAGVRDGRTGPCYGVDIVGHVDERMASREVAQQLRSTLLSLEQDRA